MKSGHGVQTARKMFFDRAKIKKKTDAATRKYLSKFGAFVRQTSRRSIRSNKGTSKPGKPPFSHSGLLKKFIYFGYDPHRHSVVIGPVVVSGKSGESLRVLESGGTVRLPDGRNVEIQPRPFMGPAFVKEQGKLASLWANSIK